MIFEKNGNRMKDWKCFKFIDLFAGIGGIRLGFESVGGTCVFSSEWDKDACKTYCANFGEMPKGDITKIQSGEIPDFDILLAGFPCQPFSIIGAREGFNHETQGTLFFEIERILKDKKPEAFMLENVRNLTAHDEGKTFKVIISHLKALGYTVYSKVLNALDYGVPQKRERIIIVGFKAPISFNFPAPVGEQEKRKLCDILEDEKFLDSKYWVKDSIKEARNFRMKKEISRPFISHENVGGNVTPHHFCCALRAGASANYILINNERRPTERELLRLQGFPEDFKIVVPYSALKKQTGNSVAVPVIKAVAKSMIDALKTYTMKQVSQDVENAKFVLDSLIKKSRVHLYKPIQVAEILYRDRVVGDINLSEVETYRNKSKKWRDVICEDLLHRVCTSSAKFQDNLFDNNAVPPATLCVLGDENRKLKGAVEAYIYQRFINKHNQLKNALNYCIESTPEDFSVKKFIDNFWNEPGLKRSIDKIYEIIVYSLFSTLVETMDMQVQISISADKLDILREFEDFTKAVMCLDFENHIYINGAKVYRVGVTNAADRGLDMYASWGPAIQIKHLSLDIELAKSIVNNVNSDRVVIVCKDVEREIIMSLLTQIGWKSKIQSIVTESMIIAWYDKALKGRYSSQMASGLLEKLEKEILNEFPAVDEIPNSLKNRNYQYLPSDGYWLL